jgi:hypothetical protein
MAFSVPTSLRTMRATAAVLLVVLAATVLTRPALAANGAVGVDDTDVDPVGTCKVDSWFSTASNPSRDTLFATSPGCVFNLGRPVDIGFGFAHGRFGSEWETLATGKIRTLIVPGGVGRWSLLFSAGLAYDVVNGGVSDVLVNIPATFQALENFKINLNGGWLWNRPDDRHWATWGAGFDWSVNDRISIIGETFGIYGSNDPERPNATDPRAQLALRFKPNENLDLDVIYGRNIFGENAHWITVGMNVRFNAFGEKAAETPLARPRSTRR